MKRVVFTVKYYTTDNSIEEKNFFKPASMIIDYNACEAFKKNCITHCSKLDNFRELMTAFYEEIEL